MILNKMCGLSFTGFESYSDVFQEIVISRALSNLHQTTCDASGYEYQTHCFPRIYRTAIVNGEIPNYFIIHRYDENEPIAKPVERFDDVLGVPKEHLVMVMKYCGDSWWNLIHDRPKTGRVQSELSSPKLLSVCYQVTLALAVAEGVYQFEHRDLHVSNVLIKPTKKEWVTFVVRSLNYRVKSFGVKACIIDTTFSRLLLGRSVYFTDLSNRLKTAASNSSPDSQEVAYQQMYQLVKDQWQDWFPQTNINWLKYFYHEVLCSDSFARNCDAQSRQELVGLIDSISQFTSLVDFVVSSFNDRDDTSDPLDQRAPGGEREKEL